MGNVRRPIPPELPRLMRSGWMCGLERTPSGVRLPKICCPSAALIRKEHPNRGLLPAMDQGNCGKRAELQFRIVGGQVQGEKTLSNSSCKSSSGQYFFPVVTKPLFPRL